MRLIKKLLSVFITIMLFSSMLNLVSAETATFVIDDTLETVINAGEYSLADSVYLLGEEEITSNGDITALGGVLSIIKEKEVTVDDITQTAPVISTVTYNIKVEETNYHEILLYGLYKTNQPAVTMLLDGEELTTKNLSRSSATSDKKTKMGIFYISSGNHTLSLKFKNGDASLKDIRFKNLEHKVGEGSTRIAANDYYTSHFDSETSQTEYGNKGDSTIKGPIVALADETSNLGSNAGNLAIYKINVKQSGQYKITFWSGTSLYKNISADFFVIDNPDTLDTSNILGAASGKPGNGTTAVSGLETGTFNLSAGSQDLYIRLNAFKDNPLLNSGNEYVFFYYFDITRVDEVKEEVSILADSKNELKAENIFYTDSGVSFSENSAEIAADSTAVFYGDFKEKGNYAVSVKYKTEAGTNVLIDNLTTEIYKGYLPESSNDYVTFTTSISSFSEGKNRITITPTQALEIDKIYITKISDESVLETINSAKSDSELQNAIIAAETALNTELTEISDEIFYKKPLFSKLSGVCFDSLSSFIKAYNGAVISEYKKPWLTLYVDGVKQTALSSGMIKLTATTGYVPEGSTMLAALFEHTGGHKKLYKFDICEQISQKTFDFELGQTEIKEGTAYALEFFYWDGLKGLQPIEVFDSVCDEIYVSADGAEEGADGTEQNPYQTIEDALLKVAEINDYQWGDIIINVKDGEYTLSDALHITEEYSGKNGYNVIIRGNGENKPVISGGRKVTEWEKDTGNIWKASLSDAGHVRKLYVNGYPAVMARTDRHYTSFKEYKDTANNKWGFTISLEDFDYTLSDPVGIELSWPYTFEHHITPVVDYIKGDDEITLLLNPELVAYRANTSFSPGVSFYLQNAKEFVNEPGEFFYDGEYVYYYPYSYEDMTKADTYVGNVEGMVKVSGSSNTSKAENITFENLTFRYGANSFISKYGYIGSQTDGYLMPFTHSEGNIAYLAQFAVDNADNINIKGCEFSCLGSAAISMIDSVSNSSIKGNIIRDISGTGIRIGSPTHNRKREGIDVCSNIDITNNVIRRIADETFNNSAITIYYEKFINVLHNSIENVPYSGISAGWGWGGGKAYDCSDYNISYNRIQNVMNSLHDGGAIYTLGPLKNTKITNNYLSDHNSRSGGLLYNDQGSALIEVSNNVALDAVLTHAVNSSNEKATRDLKIFDNYSDVGKHSKVKEGQNIYFEEYTLVTGYGDTLSDDRAKSIYENSGLTSEYMHLLSEDGVELPESGRTISSELPAPLTTEETIIEAGSYDLDTSSDNLEMIAYADGIGIGLDYGQYVNYKLDIEKAGYYKIVMRAHGEKAVSPSYNQIVLGGDVKDVIMHLDGNQRSIWNGDDKEYRVATVYLEEGEQNLTISTKYEGHRIVIRELQYLNLEQIVEPDKENLIRIKNYYNLSGIASNTYENSQSGYTSEGASHLVRGCVTSPGTGKTATFTYKINVKEAGAYNVTVAAWLKQSCTYEVTVGDVTKSAESASYASLKKSDHTVIEGLYLPKGESTLTFKSTAPLNSSGAYIFYMTLEKQN